jgi:hypothetical protein
MAAKSKRSRILQLVILAILCTLLTSMFWYPMKGARFAAKSRACMVNLKGLGVALDLYRQAYGQFPAKLSDLYPKYVTDLGSFSCPGSPRKIHRPEDIDSLAGYVLFKVDVSADHLSGSDWMDKPLLTDRRRNHLGKMDGVCGGTFFTQTVTCSG